MSGRLQAGGLPKLLTVAQVADLLGVSPKTVYAWVGQGRLSCVRLPGRLRFDPGELASWLEARKGG